MAVGVATTTGWLVAESPATGDQLYDNVPGANVFDNETLSGMDEPAQTEGAQAEVTVKRFVVKNVLVVKVAPV